MSITVRWDDHGKTLVMMTFKGKWSGRALDEGLEQAWAAASGVAHRVYGIMDFRFAARVPPDSTLALVLALNAMPSNMPAVVMLGLNSALISAASGVRNLAAKPKTLYADSLQEARQTIKQHQHDATTMAESAANDVANAMQVAPEVDDSGWLSLLKPFASSHQLTLISYGRNGAPVSTAAPFVLHTGRFYVLTVSDSPEATRLQYNPYAKITVAAANDAPALTHPARLELLAQATVILLDERAPHAAVWQQKYTARIAQLNRVAQANGQRLIWLDLQPLSMMP